MVEPMKLRERLQELKRLFWRRVFYWLDWQKQTIYEKHVRPNDPAMPEEYVTTAMVSDPKTGRILQVDVFSTEKAMADSDKREQRLLGADEEEMKELASGRYRNRLK